MNDVNLRLLMQLQFDQAKRWWGYSVLIRLLVVVIGIISLVASSFTVSLGLLVTLLTIGYVVSQWRSDSLRTTAEALLRKIELRDGLGWTLSEREVADLLLSVSKKIKAQAKSAENRNYFSSQTPPSTRRMLENLEESLWMTKHLAKRMSTYAAVTSTVVFLVAVFSLATALRSSVNQPVNEIIAQTAISVIVFIFSAGVVRLAFSYNSLASRSQLFENSVRSLLAMKRSASETQTIGLLTEYQIARATAPMLPGWVWNRMKGELNDLWLKQRSAN